MLTDYKRIYDEPETKEPVKHEKPVLFTVFRNGRSSRLEYAPWFKTTIYSSDKYKPDLTQRFDSMSQYYDILSMGRLHNPPTEEIYGFGVRYTSKNGEVETGVHYGSHVYPCDATYILKRGDKVVFPTWTIELNTTGDFKRLFNNLEMEYVLQ